MFNLLKQVKNALVRLGMFSFLLQIQHVSIFFHKPLFYHWSLPHPYRNYLW